MNLISGSTDFGTMLFAIILTFSIFTGQKLIREIFGFNKSNSFYKNAVSFALITQMYSSVKNTVKDVKAIKGAKNDLAAKKQEKILKKIEGGEPVTGNDMVKYRMMAEDQRTTSRDSSNTNKESSDSDSSRQQGKKNKIDLRRPAKNAPRRLKRAMRFYGRQAKKYTGYGMVENAVKKRKSAKVSPTKLNEKDYAIALSEMYRQEVDPTMDNEALVGEFDRIRDADISELSVDELTYRLRMESLKAQFKINDEEIRDALLYGDSQNRRWKG